MHTVRANDSETFPVASTANTSGWPTARFAHAVYDTAAPRVIPVLRISHERGL
jgi:hypothetical protein